MTFAKILLAEDDQRLAQLVSAYLQKNELDIIIEDTGDKVEAAVEQHQPNLLILDIGLPGKNGLDICRDIRPVFTGPILMLTARDSDADQVLGLEYGADDYVIKPAEPRVLLARVRALLRRAKPQNTKNNDILEFNRLIIKCAQRHVTLEDQVVTLSSHEFDLLVELAKNAGTVLSREYLFKTVYHREYDGLDRSIDVRMSQLRKKIKDDGEKPERIKTIWGRGYLFVEEAW